MGSSSLEDFAIYLIIYGVMFLFLNIFWRAILIVRIFDSVFDLTQSFINLLLDIIIKIMWPTKLSLNDFYEEIGSIIRMHNRLVFIYYFLWVSVLILFIVTIVSANF